MRRTQRNDRHRTASVVAFWPLRRLRRLLKPARKGLALCAMETRLLNTYVTSRATVNTGDHSL